MIIRMMLYSNNNSSCSKKTKKSSAKKNKHNNAGDFLLLMLLSIVGTFLTALPVASADIVVEAKSATTTTATTTSSTTILKSGVVSTKNRQQLNDDNKDNSVKKNDTTITITSASATTTKKILPKRQDEMDDEKNTKLVVLVSWYQDMFSLPSSVPFPGTGWLQRLATADDDTASSPPFLFAHKGKRYSTIYEAIVLSTNHPCRNFNAYLNSIFFSNAVAIRIVDVVCGGNIEWGHYVLCYIRNLIAAIILYYVTALLFCYGCYVWYGKAVFEDQGRTRPAMATVWNQIQLAQSSLFVYVMLPVFDEYVIERNWTAVYYTISEIGGVAWYGFFTLLYFALVEIGIYWMHRTLHTNKWLYKNIHLMHHQYNRPDTLTPWASIAFHPIDGILQASPYCVVMFLVPCHYLTHLLMLFFTAVWATYIHDAMDWNIDPIMGSKYHTVHHTHYVYNYGQVFTFCDRYWNTLLVPTAPTGVASKRKQK